MTAPIEPTAPPELKPFPQRGDPNYNRKAFDWGSAWPTFVAWLVSAFAGAWNNARAAFEGADAAVSAAASAAALRDQVLAAANFKDEWDKLAALPNPADRALNKPACVKNDGRFWMLRVNLVDVALSEPTDANTDWVSLDAGLIPSARTAGDTVAVPGVCYLFDGPHKLTLSAAYAKGQYQGYRAGDGVTGWSVDFNGHKFRKRDVGLVLGDVPLCEVDMYYEDADWGMR